MNNTKIFLHEHPDFHSLIELTAQAENIKDPYLVEKDYWLMHSIWSLQQLNLSFHLKGGTSLSKGFRLIHRFSEDIDIKIEPNQNLCGFKVYTGKNHDEDKHRNSRKEYFDWIKTYLQGKLPGITRIERDKSYDDSSKFRNGGIRLFYPSTYPISNGIKDGILLEVGFDRTAPNQPCLITSWAYELGATNPKVSAVDNRAINVLCYEPKYTFVEKLQAVIRKYRLYKEGKGGPNLPSNFIRHYYDLYQLINQNEIQSFIGTPEYEAFKIERFGGDDIKISNSEAFKLSSKEDRNLFEKEYSRSEGLYFRGRPTLQEILNRIGKDLAKL